MNEHETTNHTLDAHIQVVISLLEKAPSAVRGSIVGAIMRDSDDERQEVRSLRADLWQAESEIDSLNRRIEQMMTSGAKYEREVNELWDRISACGCPPLTERS